jgi:excisionase family DNA binding protein
MPDESDAKKEWITTQEAAELTGYSSSYIRKAIHRGRIPAEKFGRDWMLKRSDVLAYAEKMEELGPRKHDPWRTGSRERSTSEDDTDC